MSETACILTTKDFTILEVMLDRCKSTDSELAGLLRQKLNEARVVFREDVPDDVATLNSRLIYRVDDGPTNTRIISHALMRSPVGLFLPITNPRGLALLGLSEGQVFERGTPDGLESILLEKVAYQPEAERRRKNQGVPGGRSHSGRPALSLVHSSDDGRPARVRFTAVEDPDDPGPTAA